MSGPDLLSPVLLRDWPLPEPGGHKGSRGRVLVLGGARTAPGAAMLSGLAALRVGAGVLTLAVAGSVAAAVASAIPEAGLIWLDEPIGPSAAAAVADCADTADAIVVGPGLDAPDPTRELLEALIPRIPAEVPIVLDAYALGVLIDLDEPVRQALAGRLVLTPNESEVERLAPDENDLDARLTAGSDRFQAVLSCQNTIVAPGGRRWQVPAGHAGLGTSGSGDVLAGAITGLLARGATPEQAACWGTYLHATAGERLAGRVGPLGFLARELLDPLPTLLAELPSRAT